MVRKGVPYFQFSLLATYQLFRDAETKCSSKVTKNGDVMTGGLLLSADGDVDRVLGCTDIILQRTFSLPLGNSHTNQLSFTYSRNGPAGIQTTVV